jgi:hypothetical protein
VGCENAAAPGDSNRLMVLNEDRRFNADAQIQRKDRTTPASAKGTTASVASRAVMDR